MPFTRISLREGRSEQYIQGVSDALHRALVDCFEVPPTDRFQLIEELPANRLVCDRNYMAPDGRTENMIVFQITAGRERSDATRNAFFCRLVQELEQSIGLRAADVMVIITTNRLAEWSFSGGISAGAQS